MSDPHLRFKQCYRGRRVFDEDNEDLRVEDGVTGVRGTGSERRRTVKDLVRSTQKQGRSSGNKNDKVDRPYEKVFYR